MITIASAAKMPDVISFGIILNNKIFSIPIGNINITVGCNNGFCWNIFFCLCVLAGFFWIIKCKQHSSVDGGFNYLVAVVIANE